MPTDHDDVELPPAAARARRWTPSWVLLAAAGIIVFLVGVTFGALTRDSGSPRVRVTTTVTAVVTAPALGAGGSVVGVGGQFGDGLYQVGVDISAGNYRTDGGKNCYWERLSDLSGGFSAIIANGEPTSPTTVRVMSSDKGFGVHGGCIWTRVT